VGFGATFSEMGDHPKRTSKSFNSLTGISPADR
jgi:hypothetical protein